MKKILFLGAILVSLVACKDTENRKVVQAETPEGRSFYYMPIDEAGVTDITITMAWPMGWAYDADLNPATPYVAAEAILSGGTPQLRPQDVLELFNDKNASGRLYVRSDHAIGELSFPKEHIADIVSVSAQMLTSPKFDPAWLERIKQGFIVNQTQFQTQTANQMWAAARQAVLGQRALNAFLSLPDLSAIEAVGIEDLHDWHTATLTQDVAAIVVTGAIDRADAGKAVDDLLGHLPDASAQAQVQGQSQGQRPGQADSVGVADFAPRTILLHLPQAEKTTLALLGPLPPTAKGGDLADLLAVHLFGRPGDGPLFQAIRTDLRASYGFQAGFTNYDRATRFMFITGEVEAAKLAQAVDVIRTTYDSYRTTSDFDGFEDVRKNLSEGTAKNVLYVDVAARTMLELALDERDPSVAPNLGALFAEVSTTDVAARLATAFPAADRLIVLAASPDADVLPGACVITDIAQASDCP